MPGKKATKTDISDCDIGNLMKHTEEILESRRKNVKKMISTLREEIDADLETTLSSLDSSLLKMTLSEARQFISSCSSASTLSQNSKLRRRSKSCNSMDDGYLTADSGASYQPATKNSAFKRPRSKSLLKKKANKENRNDFMTPMNRRPIPNTGITPKVELNAPAMVIRDAKQGEVAFSSRGSPLMASRDIVNVHIPLGNGDLLNLQPRKGLRRSQIPELRRSTQQQLHSLLEYLNKICDYFQKE